MKEEAIVCGAQIRIREQHLLLIQQSRLCFAQATRGEKYIIACRALCFRSPLIPLACYSYVTTVCKYQKSSSSVYGTTRNLNYRKHTEHSWTSESLSERSLYECLWAHVVVIIGPCLKQLIKRILYSILLKSSSRQKRKENQTPFKSNREFMKILNHLLGAAHVSWQSCMVSNLLSLPRQL